MRLTLSSTFRAPAERVWALVGKSGTLRYVCRGVLGFSGADQFPERWQEGTRIETRLLFLGWIPTWRHELYFEAIDEQARRLHTRERGGPVSVWEHRIIVVPRPDGSCRYTDEVEIGAGLLTPLVWLFALLLYRYRQWRWRRLLQYREAVPPADSL